MEKFNFKLPAKYKNVDYNTKMRMQKDYHEKSMKAKSIFTTNVLPGKHSVFVFDPVANKYYYKIVIIEMKIATEHQKYWI